MKLIELLQERITSKHVVHTNKITAIMNLVQSKFGPPDVAYAKVSYGTCLLAQINASLLASTNFTQEELSRYFNKVKANFNNFGETVDAINKTPIAFGDRSYKIEISVHKVSSADELKGQIQDGQPVICAFSQRSRLAALLNLISSASDNESEEEWRLETISHHVRYVTDNAPAKKDVSKIAKELHSGFVSKDAWKTGRDRKPGTTAFHSVLCFGYDAGDDAFLFRESRNIYGRNGYFKVASELFNSKNLSGTDFFQGMFYVQLDSLEELPKTSK